MPNKPFTRILPLLAVALLAGCATLTGPSQKERNQAATRVLEAYGVPDMLGQVAPIINDSLENNLPATVPADTRERLTRAVSAVYERDALARDLATRLRERADADERAGVLIEAADQLETPLAETMIAREQKAATEEFAKGFKEFLDQPVKEEHKPRIESARKLVERMRLVDLQVAFNVGMLRGMVSARNAAASAQYQTSDENADRMAEQTETSLRKRMNRQLPIMLFYAYREASDDELSSYAELQAGPALSWINSAIPEALSATLADAAARVPGRFQELAQQGGGDSG